jgi:CheY-like chemotaxis protein
MENKLNRYVNSSFLVIDDFVDFRQSLKSMIQGMGATDIELAGSGREAVELYCKNSHDIVLLDFNLGDGINGLQLLEELSLKDILRHDTIVILVTGETSMEMVQGAIDVSPDDYLPKPFTKATLKKRMDKAFEKNEALKLVSVALNNRDYLKAISCCDHLIANKSRYALACHRIKADSCLRMGKPNQALAIYEGVLDIREISWALLGRARCKIHKSDYLDAISDFDKIIKTQRYSLEAYDQKTEALLAIGDYENAYKVIQTAIAIGGNSILRQRKLADLAMRYQHYDTALVALRKVISLSRYLPNKIPEDYLKLAQVLSLVHSGNFGAQSRRAPTELSKLLKEIQLVFQSNIQTGIAGTIHGAIRDFMASQSSDGEIKIKAAFSKLEDLPDKIKPFLYDEIKFARKVCPDIESVGKLYEVFYAENHKKQLNNNFEKASAFNQQGMKKFREKEFDVAYASFKTAYINANKNINIALNLMQVMVKLISRNDVKEDFSELLDMCAETVKSLANSDQRASHFKLLFRHIRSHLINVKRDKG